MLQLLFSELSPVAAIVGGVLAQEIIKVISNKDAPHNNFFLYNPMETCGVVETIGYQYELTDKIDLLLILKPGDNSISFLVGNI